MNLHTTLGGIEWQNAASISQFAAFTMYSRQSPSKRYQELIEQNRRLHLQGAPAQGLPPELSFPGKSIFRQLPHIKRLVEATASVSLLDYGCGKGQQYEAQSINVNGAQVDATVQDFLDVDYIY